MWGDIAVAFLLAFIASFVTVPYTIKLASKVGAIDMPSDRRVNKRPIPRIGGIAILVGFLISSFYLIFTSVIENKIILNDSDHYLVKLIGFLIGILILEAFAFTDDLKDIRPWQKLVGQLLAAGVIFACGIRIDVINSFVLPTWLSCVLTIGWIVGITNAINLIDGLDGLSSGISLISAFLLLVIFATNYSPLISVVLITALAGSIMGFMPYNIHPAKTFMGDIGSQFLGFTLSVISIMGVAKTVTLIVLIAPVLVLGLPIFDTVFAIIRRIIKGKSLKAVFKADRGHLHHRLMAQGFTQKQSVSILYAASASLGMISIILIEEGFWKAISLFAIICVIIAVGYRELKKYKNALVEENIEEKLVDVKDIKKGEDGE